MTTMRNNRSNRAVLLTWVLSMLVCGAFQSSMVANAERGDEYDGCNPPAESSVKSATLLVNVLGNPDLLGEGDMDGLGRKFKNVYNNQAVRQCDVSFREILRADFSVYRRPGRVKANEKALAYSLLVHVEYSCSGPYCDIDDVLLSQVGGLYGPRGRRSLQEEGAVIEDDAAADNEEEETDADDEDESAGTTPHRKAIALDVEPEEEPACVSTCPLAKATYQALTAVKMEKKFNNKMSTFDGIDRVQNILEVNPFRCGSPEESEGTLQVEVPEDATPEDLELLAGSFTNAYNYYSDVKCGSMSGQDGYAQIDFSQALNANRRELAEAERVEGHGDGRELGTTYFFDFEFRYTCYGCPASWNLWDDAIRRRKLANGREAIIRPRVVKQRRNLRYIATSSPELCFCAKKAGSIGPQLEEMLPPFGQSFVSMISQDEDLFNGQGIGSITEVSP